MRLEEAIDHLEEMLADEHHEWPCDECREEHEQLLGWLKELNGLRLENEVILRRLRHLLDSDYISSFDRVYPSTQEYIRDIREADRSVVYLCDKEKPCKIHCEKDHHCKHTSDITHAKNFHRVEEVTDREVYEENDEHCIANLSIDEEKLHEIVDKAMADVYRWIPVSERYPEEEENYLVTIKFGDMNIIQVARFSCDLTTVDPVGVDMQGEEYKRPGFWIHESEYGFSSLNVIAWKNLPIAYKGEDGKWVRP